LGPRSAPLASTATVTIDARDQPVCSPWWAITSRPR
jgi:hypothetical protein